MKSKDMDIEIRRNRDIKFEFELDENQRETIVDFLKPQLADEFIKQMLDDNNRLKREICNKIMNHAVETRQRDQSGALITPETHEVGCDVGFVLIDGEQWAYPTRWYVRPKKSEYEK